MTDPDRSRSHIDRFLIHSVRYCSQAVAVGAPTCVTALTVAPINSAPLRCTPRTVRMQSPQTQLEWSVVKPGERKPALIRS
jgi:hypothetical protein